MCKFILIVKIYCRKGGIQLNVYLTLVTKTLMSLDLHELLSLQERAYIIVYIQRKFCEFTTLLLHKKMYILLDATKIENVCYKKDYS